MEEGAEPIQNSRHSKYISPKCPQSRARLHRGRGSTPESGQPVSLGSEFLPSSTHSCPGPGWAPHSHLPLGASKHRLGCKYRFLVQSIFWALWPPLALALTRTLLSVNDVGLEVRVGWGAGLSTGARLNRRGAHSAAGGKEVHGQRGTWNSLGNHSCQHGQLSLCSETLRCPEPAQTKPQL